MSPEHKPPVTWEQVPKMVARFADLVEEEDVSACARAALELIGDLGAVEAHLNLDVPHAIGLTWTPSTGVMESEDEPSELLEGLRGTALKENVASITVPGAGADVHWAGLAVPGSDGPLGTVVFALEADAPECIVGFALLASTLGVKTGQIQAQAEGQRESARTAGWFKTLDEQIRVLEGERQKFSALVNKTDASVFVTDPDGQIAWVNSVMAHRYGDLDRSSLVGSTCNVICGKDAGCDNCPIKLIREGQPMLHQERDEIRNGETRHLYVSAFPVRAPDGNVSQVLVMMQDITDLETLRKSEARYQLLFERSADAIVMAEPDSLRIVMANRQARDLLGVDPGSDRTLLSIHPPEMQEEMGNRFRSLSRGSTLENAEVGVLGKNGEFLTCNACGTVFDLDGTDVLLIEYRDVTYLRRLQGELARADHLITLGTMNAGIAHEFKNRLAPIRAFAQLITLHGTELDKLRNHAPLMIQEIDRLTALVRDILDYARPQDPHRMPQSFNRLIRGCADEFLNEYKSVITGCGITCDVVFPSGPERFVLVDTSQIRRAFLNLFKNSLEAIAGVDAEKRLRIEVLTRKDQVVMAMSDTGVGIAEDNLSRIFDPFFTTKGPQGTGLGMCITKSLIEANDGSIRVTANPGGGTRVELTFPTVEAGAAEQAITGKHNRDAA